MRSKIILLISCIILAACAGEDIKETGITRERAISIAKTNCKEYPDRFSFVDKAEWIPEKHFWAVELADRSGFNGRTYKINRKGEIVGTHEIHDNRRYNDDGGPGPYRGGWWYY
ncbi:MAG: hypothetical protein WCD79_03375 [Chthoniobacteraceae bacterium]